MCGKDRGIQIRNIEGQKGFTLVELSIVIVVIGLLIGGVLKGQEMYANAQITATISQVQSYEAATILFYDQYNALPGDMRGASTKIPDCDANCEPYLIGSGNFQVGNPAWASAWQSQTQFNVTLPATDEGAEVTLYWAHLVKANYITGVASNGLLPGTTSAWGETNPSAKLGGGFVVGYADGTPTPGQPFGGSLGGP